MAIENPRCPRCRYKLKLCKKCNGTGDFMPAIKCKACEGTGYRKCDCDASTDDIAMLLLGSW